MQQPPSKEGLYFTVLVVHEHFMVMVRQLFAAEFTPFTCRFERYYVTHPILLQQ
jgi:hypothetical protein